MIMSRLGSMRSDGPVACDCLLSIGCSTDDWPTWQTDSRF